MFTANDISYIPVVVVFALTTLPLAVQRARFPHHTASSEQNSTVSTSVQAASTPDRAHPARVAGGGHISSIVVGGCGGARHQRVIDHDETDAERSAAAAPGGAWWDASSQSRQTPPEVIISARHEPRCSSASQNAEMSRMLNMWHGRCSSLLVLLF